MTRAEHLRRLVADARTATDAFSRERVRRELKDHLAKVDEFARSFGAQQVASVVGDAAAEDSYSGSLLDAIDNVATILTTPGIDLREMESRLAVGERRRWTPVGVPPAPSAPRTRPDRAAARSGHALRDMIDASLTQLSSLEEIPLAEPVSNDEDAVVPVEILLYRGQAALERARALRDELRSRGVTDPDALNELYELLDLARVE